MKKLLLLAASLLSSAVGSVVHAELPELTTDLNSPKYYLIKNVRSSNYAAIDNSESQVKQLNEAAVNAVKGKYQFGSLWYFVAADDATAAEGWTAVRIYNAAIADAAIANIENGLWLNSGSNIVWYINNEPTEQFLSDNSSSTTGHAINHSAEITNAQGWNNKNGFGALVAYYSSADAGSTWEFVKADETKASATAADAIDEMNNIMNPITYNRIKTNGNVLANIDNFPAEKKAAWEAAIATVPESPSAADIQSITSAYEALVEGTHIMFASHKVSTDFLGQYNGYPRRCGGESMGSRVFTLKSAGAAGFYVYNEYMNSYIVHPIRNNYTATFNTDKNSATVYNIDVWKADEKAYGIYSTDKSLANDQLYWHSNNSNELWCWQADDNSSWYVSFADDNQAATEHYNGAKNAASVVVVGSGPGEYTFDADKEAALSQAISLAETATNEQKRDAAAQIYDALSTKVFNMPVAGHFYRIQNVSSGKYIENVNTSSRINVVEDVAGNTPGTVLYYDGSRLVSYSTGLVLGKFLSMADKASWQFFDKDATDASANIVFAESATAGKYTICPSDGRYISGAGTQVDCGSGDENNGYRWAITEVTWLPVYFGDAAETTIYSPVALNLSGRAKAHTLYANTEAPAELVKTEVTAIEPNTPYLLTDHTTNTTQGWNATTKCVYLGVKNDGAVAAAENPNALSGSIYATQKASGKSYFTLGTEGEDAYFLAHSADYVPGFTAHYAVAADAVVAEGKYKVVSEDKKTTGISEVVAGGENGAKVIYDLQGRRVANASKGIFIINGVKTLVK